jgi:hypothetical protein
MQPTRILPAAILLAAVSLACNGDALSGPEWPELPGGAVVTQFNRIEQAHTTQFSGIDDRRRLVIRTKEEWVAFWNEFTGNIHPQPPAPAIDFGRQMVVAATMGLRNTGGYTTAIEEIFETQTALIVRVLETSPGPNCLTTQALSAPATAVSLSARDLSVEFQEATVIAECT